MCPGKPSCAYAEFSDPGRTDASGPYDAPTWPPHPLRRRLAARTVISGLNRTASTLAVYASPIGSPAQDTRLASGCWPSSTRRDWLPAGLQRKVFKLLPASRPPFPSFMAQSGSVLPAQQRMGRASVTWRLAVNVGTGLEWIKRLGSTPQCGLRIDHREHAGSGRKHAS
jgi:hypothetical protein